MPRTSKMPSKLGWSLILGLLGAFGCSGATSDDKPPAAARPIAKGAYQARGVHVAPQVPTTTEPQGFPLVAPDPPFGAPPSPSSSGSAAPIPTAYPTGKEL